MSAKTTKTTGCANCPKMEQKYRDNPRSFWMRLWKWHSGWCPGHKAYRKAQEANSSSQSPG